jgi:hypothetical protein
MNPLYHRFYFDADNRPKRSGIYCQIFDRWLLIDSYDFWITLETAKILSSKVASIVYVLPNAATDINNENCLEYSLLDKAKQLKGIHPDVIRGQVPILKVLEEADQIYFQGLPEDYKEGASLSQLNQLKEYVTFIQTSLYAVNLIDAQNYDDNRSFAEKIVPEEWLTTISTRKDRTNIEEGVIKKIKQILYFSNTVEQAETEISNVLNDIHKSVPGMAEYYYRLIGKKHEFK